MAGGTRSVEAVGRTTSEGDTTTIRALAHLDRGGDPCVAKAFAAFVRAAQASAQGHIRLVNDGTYSGEGGVSVLVGGGVLKRERIEDSNDPLIPNWEPVHSVPGEGLQPLDGAGLRRVARRCQAAAPRLVLRGRESELDGTSRDQEGLPVGERGQHRTVRF